MTTDEEVEDRIVEVEMIDRGSTKTNSDQKLANQSVSCV
jgi:hypothetical protein